VSSASLTERKEIMSINKTSKANGFKRLVAEHALPLASRAIATLSVWGRGSACIMKNYMAVPALAFLVCLAPAAKAQVAPVPIITGLSPSSGPNSGGTEVTVHGEGFGPITSEPQVTFGEVPGTVLSCTPPNTCTVISPHYVVGQGTTPQIANVQMTFSGITSVQTQNSGFTYLPGPVCTAKLSCANIPPGLFPVLLLQCPSPANFYDGSLGEYPDSSNTTSYSALTNDLWGWQAVACTGQQPTLSGGSAGGSCSFYSAFASPTFCGTAPPQPPNFCQECRTTGGICTTGPNGRKLCIHE
jgi:hypothetical protein